MYFANLLAVALLAPAMAIQAMTVQTRAADVNPFAGKDFYANSGYAKKLEETINTFKKSGDETNAKRTEVVQKTGTFVWMSDFDDVCLQYNYSHPIRCFCLTDNQLGKL